jgi:hypothetical protein
MSGRKLRKRATADRYDVVTKTIDRWVADPKLGFPAPFFINKVPYWNEDELIAFERSRARPSRPQAELETPC